MLTCDSSSTMSRCQTSFKAGKDSIFCFCFCHYGGKKPKFPFCGAVVLEFVEKVCCAVSTQRSRHSDGWGGVHAPFAPMGVRPTHHAGQVSLPAA